MSTAIGPVFVAAVIAFATSLVGVGLFRRYAQARGRLDIPNSRSSHTVPTPRGGGLVIAVVVLAGYLISALYAGYSISTGYIAGAAVIVIISWLDDIYSIAFHWRLIVHVIAGLLLIADVGYFDTVFVPAIGNVYLGRLGLFLTVLAVVWTVNAYNFMDGIDGIAAGQSISASIGWLLLAVHFRSADLVLLSALVGSASVGFLVHNWPPAKIFMGDAGSAFLGFTFAGLPLLARERGFPDPEHLPWIGTLFLWLFIFDSVTTIIRRLLRGDRIWEAHRSHLYQRMVINGYSHRRVTSLYFALSILLMLLVCAYGAKLVPLSLTAGVAGIISTVVVVAFFLSRQRSRSE
jgi:Fuc2NAc and GlcNAc transferase